MDAALAGKFHFSIPQILNKRVDSWLEFNGEPHHDGCWKRNATSWWCALENDTSGWCALENIFSIMSAYGIMKSDWNDENINGITKFPCFNYDVDI